MSSTDPPLMNGGQSDLQAPTMQATTSSEGAERGRSRSPILQIPLSDPQNQGSTADRSRSSPSRPPTSAEIDAVIAAAIANAPPPPPPQPEYPSDNMTRSVTPLMTNLLPSAVGLDGRVNLFVGNLPYRVRWQDLKDLFRKAGTVLRADVSLGPDNRSRGYGTVLMGSREDAARAIDRYNGYTWQTRTLEVRPDRLPPEYEAQSHAPHHTAPNRHGMLGFHNPAGGSHPHPPFPVSGHLTPSGGPGWLPTQRPPFGLPSIPGSHGLLSVPSMGVSPVAQPMSINGSSPIPPAQSPAAIYNTLPLPLSIQNTGGPPYQLAASPLAGSLTAGTSSVPPPILDNVRRDSLAPYSHTSPDMTPRSTSPALGSTSRPSSSSGKPSSSPSKDGQTSRAPPPGTLGPLPPSLFASVNSPEIANDTAEPLGKSPSGGQGVGKLSNVPPKPAMEGLAHQGMGLGPPNTLHDRVIFVSNLPLSMQWQDLKDLLRPAGTIIRADVATDGHGRPRGFGTALFANESDASRAVNMFNDRDIAGHRIRAHLERDSHSDAAQRPPAGQNGTIRGSQSPPQYQGEPSQSAEILSGDSHVPPIDTSTPIAPSRFSAGAAADSSPATKLPWSLNTSLQTHQTPGRPSFRQIHHPGPISMPSFPPMEHGHPMSPQTRGLPPMTPSMPGFVFNAYPETPPIHPHFMSPGIGPFSPGIPVTSPTTFQYNPFLNAAPGAPVNRYPQGGSAQLGTPTTQAFPNPSGQGAGPIHQYAGPPGPPNISQTLDYFPNMAFQPQQPLSFIPDSPSPRITSRPPPSASPLNAKDRLAPDPPALPGLPDHPGLSGPSGPATLRGPTQTENGTTGLEAFTSALDLSDGAREDEGRDRDRDPPESPSMNARTSSRARETNGTGIYGYGGSIGGAGAGAGGERASLDESRSFGSLGVEIPGERRASFGATTRS